MFARSRTRVSILWPLLLACLLLLLTRLGWLKPVYNGFNRLLVPIWYLVHAPVAMSQHVAHHWLSHQHLAEQNAMLGVEKQVLSAKLKGLEASIRENKQLRDLLSSSGRIRGSFITADLLAVLHRAEGQEWILNRGHDSDVYAGQPVLDASGVVGQIQSVGKYSSRLLLVTDARVAVPVETESGRIKAILVGSGHRHMKLRYLPDSSGLKTGDILVASGLGLQFPRGYPVGQVVRIRSVSGSDFSDVDVVPLATLSLGRVLLLVWSDLSQAEREAKKWLSGEGV